jgi:cysteine-rich repeat protein
VPDGSNVTWIGPCSPVDLSGDGQTVLASEGVWDRTTGWTPLPGLPDGAELNTPLLLSADGHVVFGCSGPAIWTCELYRWTREGGIQGLGRPYIPSRAFGDNLGADASGQTLVTCGADEDGEPTLLRWTQSGSFEAVETGLGPSFVACGTASSAVLSSNGLNIVFNFGSDDLGELAVVRNRAAAPGEVRTVTELYKPHNNSHQLVVTAISGNGAVYAAYQNNDGAIDTCLLDPSCSLGERGVIADLNFEGNIGVGHVLDFGGSDGRSVAPMYWSQTGGAEFISDVFAARGVVLDPPPGVPLSISDDGRTFLGTSNRRRADGSRYQECFVATLGEATTSDPLPAVPAACGNGLPDPGEACDDGNLNNSDACTTRCQRIAIAGGPSNTCAIHDGRVECWGENASLLGPGDVSRAWSPVTIPSTDGAIQLSVGYNHACAVLAGGSVRCWGSNNGGKLGDGSFNDSASAVDVVGLMDAVQVAAGGAHSCALRSNGTVRCWGNNSVGQLGDATMLDSPTPVDVPNLANVVQLNSSATDFTCALLADATVSCWGSDYALSNSAEPAAVSGLSTVREIPSLAVQAQALLFDGSLVQWTGFDMSSSSTESLPADVVQVRKSDEFGLGCHLYANGTIQCFGRDEDGGMLGSGERWSGGPVVGIQNAVQIATSDDGHACALLASGEARCWGNDSRGQLGVGVSKSNFPTNVSSPVSVLGFR